jgi:hypothetical protein
MRLVFVALLLQAYSRPIKKKLLVPLVAAATLSVTAFVPHQHSRINSDVSLAAEPNGLPLTPLFNGPKIIASSFEEITQSFKKLNEFKREQEAINAKLTNPINKNELRELIKEMDIVSAFTTQNRDSVRDVLKAAGIELADFIANCVFSNGYI